MSEIPGLVPEDAAFSLWAGTGQQVAAAEHAGCAPSSRGALDSTTAWTEPGAQRGPRQGALQPRVMSTTSQNAFLQSVVPAVGTNMGTGTLDRHLDWFSTRSGKRPFLQLIKC